MRKMAKECSIKVRMMRLKIPITGMCELLEKRGVKASYNDVQRSYHGDRENPMYGFICELLDELELEKEKENEQKSEAE